MAKCKTADTVFAVSVVCYAFPFRQAYDQQKRRTHAEASVSSNRKPAQRLRFEKEEQRRERALTFEKSRSKRYKACSDVVRPKGLEPPTFRTGI